MGRWAGGEGEEGWRGDEGGGGGTNKVGARSSAEPGAKTAGRLGQGAGPRPSVGASDPGGGDVD